MERIELSMVTMIEHSDNHCWQHSKTVVAGIERSKEELINNRSYYTNATF